MLTSMVCRYAHFEQDWLFRWAELLGLEAGGREAAPEARNIHRKVWEWCAIAQALEERDLLRPGQCGLGFAVGTEPLAAAFAARGVSVLGTDLGQDAGGWTSTNQHAASREALFKPHLISREAFDRNVAFEPADMRNLASLAGRSFDFVWSSCSFEHLGALEEGMRFVVNAMDLVRPGGVAVHTTEFNVSSNGDTLESGPNVIYRRRDIEELGGALRDASSALEPVDFEPGAHRYDIEFDYPPFHTTGRKHVKLLLAPYISTSILLIVRKGAPPPAAIAAMMRRALR